MIFRKCLGIVNQYVQCVNDKIQQHTCWCKCVCETDAEIALSVGIWKLRSSELPRKLTFSFFFFLFWPRGLFLQSLAFPRSADIYFIALYSSAQFFPGLRMELLTLLALYSENHCQVWIKCFIWRVQLLLIHHKGSFYRIIVIGTNAMLFTIDTLIAPNSLLPVIYISMSPITPPSRFRAVYELR